MSLATLIPMRVIHDLETDLKSSDQVPPVGRVSYQESDKVWWTIITTDVRLNLLQSEVALDHLDTDLLLEEHAGGAFLVEDLPTSWRLCILRAVEHVSDSRIALEAVWAASITTGVDEFMRGEAARACVQHFAGTVNE